MNHGDEQYNHEEALIGGLLARPDLIPEARALVSAGDFASGPLGDAYEWLATAKLKADGSPHDRLAFLGWTKKTKVSFAANSTDTHEAACRRIVDQPHGAFVEVSAKRIAAAAVMRRMATLAGRINAATSQYVTTDDDVAADLLEGVAADIAAIQAKSTRGELTSIKAASTTALAEIESRLFGQTRLGVPVGFTGLDRMLSGMRGGELIILAARPGVGKSALAANFAANVCDKNGGRVLFVSLEMSSTELAERMLSSLSGVAHHGMRQGNITPNQRTAIVEAAATLATWELQIDDRASIRIQDVVAMSRRMQMRGGLDLVVLDYLQLVTPDNARDPRQEQVAKMSRGLKLAAKSLKVPVLCLAQLNRQADSPSDKPRLSHLRESGAIEQDADAVLFIHRPEPTNGVKDTNATLIVAKQRNGPTGEIALTWDESHVTFLEREPERCQFLPRTVEPREQMEGGDVDQVEFNY